MTLERLELLAKIAGLYFEEGRTQAQIARQTGYSRSMVSRLLKAAKEQGIVEVRIHHPLGRRSDIEKTLRETFHLQEVRVLQSNARDYPMALRGVGVLAARLVEELLQDEMTIGMSWGTSLAEMVFALRPQPRTGIHVVQIIGSMGSADLKIDGPELARTMAHLLGGRYTILPAPLFVDSEATQVALMHDRRVQDVLCYAETMNIALIGVGTVEYDYSSMVRSGYLRPDQLAVFAEAGAVGDVCAIHFDIHGQLAETALQRRFVNIDPARLLGVPLRVGIACGSAKARPILGALRSGLINALVTDDRAASHVLQLLKNTSPPAQ